MRNGQDCLSDVVGWSDRDRVKMKMPTITLKLPWVAEMARKCHPQKVDDAGEDGIVAAQPQVQKKVDAILSHFPGPRNDQPPPRWSGL